MSFRLVPNSVTLNDLEQRSGHYFHYVSDISSIRGALPLGTGTLVALV